jgi:hypothetical protein
VRDGKWIQALKTKFSNTDKLSKKLHLGDNGNIDSSPFKTPLTVSETNFILRIDEIEEIYRDNLELYAKANQVCKQVEEAYTNLSAKIFDLADVYNKMSSNYKKLENCMDMGSLKNELSDKSIHVSD